MGVLHKPNRPIPPPPLFILHPLPSFLFMLNLIFQIIVNMFMVTLDLYNK